MVKALAKDLALHWDLRFVPGPSLEMRVHFLSIVSGWVACSSVKIFGDMMRHRLHRKGFSRKVGLPELQRLSA